MPGAKKLVIGLGNPGREYEDTYHSVGALAVRAIAGTLAWKPYKKLFLSASSDGTAFVLPLVFMNESGRAASAAAKKFGTPPEDIVLVHDDSDLPVGTYKISIGRGSAGHKGAQSVIEALGTNAFTRIRIGIRPPREARRRKAGEFVLKKISPRDRAVFEKIFASL